jgi:hypothetical protein
VRGDDDRFTGEVLEADDTLDLERLSSYARWIQRDRESAREAAQYDREQRDQVTSRIRFGSVVFNGASLLTVLNTPQLLSGVPTSIILTSSVFFLLGVVSAGYSLVTHQTELIRLAGFSAARAMCLDRAVALLDRSPNEDEVRQAHEAIEEAHHLHGQTIKPKLTAIWLQNLSTGAWLGGAAVIALAKFGDMLPPWPWF